jgi:hypothetical protein
LTQEAHEGREAERLGTVVVHAYYRRDP